VINTHDPVRPSGGQNSRHRSMKAVTGAALIDSAQASALGLEHQYRDRVRNFGNLHRLGVGEERGPSRARRATAVALNHRGGTSRRFERGIR
jgi:hypothetical protein